MSDLKLIDELLCDLRAVYGLSWAEMESHSSITRAAMRRLREAWTSGEMPVITLGIANHFRATKSPLKRRSSTRQQQDNIRG